MLTAALWESTLLGVIDTFLQRNGALPLRYASLKIQKVSTEAPYGQAIKREALLCAG